MPRPTRDTEFSSFVRDHRAELLQSARLLTAGDPHLAEDLVQTALARLYAAWPREFRSGTAVAYVRRILVNAHIDETRRPRWRRERTVPELPDLPDPGRARSWPAGSGSASAGDHGPDADWMDDRIDGGAVRAALAALPPRMRAAVVLRHWLDLSVEESADLLGCSEGTVKSQTAKAVARLRVALEPAPARFDVTPAAGLRRSAG